jgi:hypothetical protein
MKKRKLVLCKETVAHLNVIVINNNRERNATNSSECGACSCEQYCEQ